MKRLRLAWHILRGGSLIYKVHFVEGNSGIHFHPGVHSCKIEECVFEGDSSSTGLKLELKPIFRGIE